MIGAPRRQPGVVISGMSSPRRGPTWISQLYSRLTLLCASWRRCSTKSSPPSDAELLRVGLLHRLDFVEGLELHACVEHAHGDGIRREIAFISLGIEDLRHEATVGKRRKCALAKFS